MKKVLLSVCLLALFCQLGLHAEEKMSPSTQNFLRSYESTPTVQRSKLKSTYAVTQENNRTIVSAFLHLNDENNLEGLAENNVTINAQYGTILSVRIPAESLEAVSQLPSVKYIEIGRPVHKLMDNVRSATFSNVDALHAGTGLTQAYTGKDVVVGIIDGGFQYNHINFYDTAGETLRVKRVWNQNATGTPPSGYYYGREYTTAESIEAAQQDMNDCHATHVAGIAAGAYHGNEYYGIAPDADLVFVSYNLYDTSSSNTSISDGIKYIYDYAESVGKPCVINMSLGYHIGPHDGTSTFDRICDSLQGEGRLLVGASGNEAEDNMHVKKTLSSSNDTLKTLVDLGQQQSTAIDIWGDADKTLSIKIIVYDPRNNKKVYTSNAFSTATSTSQKISNPAGVYGNIYIATAKDPNNDKGNITIDMENVFSISNYYVGFEVSSTEGTTINAWTNTPYTSFSNLGLSGFTNGDNDSSMGEIGGTGKRIISVGAYTSSNHISHKNSSMYDNSYQTINQLATFSSHGPTADGRMKPDISAPGTMIVSSFNASTCNNRRGEYYDFVVEEESVNGKSYYFGSMEGTSMASPVVTGVLATWLQARPTLTPEQVREIFAQSAKTDNYTGDIAGVGNNLWGYGKIDAYNGLVDCLELSGIEEVGAPTRPMVYPNPAAESCYFLLPSDDQHVTVALYALNGAEVYSQYAGDIQAGEQTPVSLNGIAPGIYVMRIIGEKNHITTKLTVK
ncbi:MAG TPA: S8 family peptidase [Candidatus Barnesiella merdipullorum]|nr:S8 family peptidase [Candidatus Barnesiella merdipullorum]